MAMIQRASMSVTRVAAAAQQAAFAVRHFGALRDVQTGMNGGKPISGGSVNPWSLSPIKSVVVNAEPVTPQAVSGKSPETKTQPLMLAQRLALRGRAVPHPAWAPHMPQTTEAEKPNSRGGRHVQYPACADHGLHVLLGERASAHACMDAVSDKRPMS